jgi:predicted nucleic acid-binding protein
LGLNRFRAFLRLHRLVALDTSIFIYQLEANPRYLPFTDHIFAWLETRDVKAVTSTITMTELLVQPYRADYGNRVDEFYRLLSAFPNLEWIAPSLEIADTAARIRATHRLRTPDALLAATATHAQATGLITNDGVFERVDAFETLA